MQLRLVLGVVALDLATKALATAVEPSGAVLPVENHSYALGVGGLPPAALVLGSLIVLVAYGRFVTRRSHAADMPRWVASLVIGGALANLIDRSLHGAVRDFILVGPVVVNLADVAVVAGLIGFFSWPRISGRQHALATRGGEP